VRGLPLSASANQQKYNPPFQQATTTIPAAATPASNFDIIASSGTLEEILKRLKHVSIRILWNI